MFKFLIKLTVLLFYTLNIDKAFAEQQGSLSTEKSVGEVEVAIEISDLVQISDLDDFNFSNWNKVDDMQQSDLLCVYSNNLRGIYYISARGTGPGDNFEVSDGINSVNFDVFWQDSVSSGNSGTKLRPNKSIRMAEANFESFDCNGNLNAQLTILFAKSDLSSAFASTYKGTIIITISPE